MTDYWPLQNQISLTKLSLSKSPNLWYTIYDDDDDDDDDDDKLNDFHLYPVYQRFGQS